MSFDLLFYILFTDKQLAFAYSLLNKLVTWTKSRIINVDSARAMPIFCFNTLYNHINIVFVRIESETLHISNLFLFFQDAVAVGRHSKTPQPCPPSFHFCKKPLLEQQKL